MQHVLQSLAPPEALLLIHWRPKQLEQPEPAAALQRIHSLLVQVSGERRRPVSHRNRLPAILQLVSQQAAQRAQFCEQFRPCRIR